MQNLETGSQSYNLAMSVTAKRQQLADIHKRRMVNVEASKRVREQSPKAWVCLPGQVFIKLPAESVKEGIDNEQKELSAASNGIEQEIAVIMSTIRKLSPAEQRRIQAAVAEVDKFARAGT